MTCRQSKLSFDITAVYSECFFTPCLPPVPYEGLLALLTSSILEAAIAVFPPWPLIARMWLLCIKRPSDHWRGRTRESSVSRSHQHVSDSLQGSVADIEQLPAWWEALPSRHYPQGLACAEELRVPHHQGGTQEGRWQHQKWQVRTCRLHARLPSAYSP